MDIHTQNPERGHIHSQVELTDKAAVVLFDVLKGRRSEHLAQLQLPNPPRQEVAADRAMLSRQLNRYEDSLVLKISDLLYVNRARVMRLKHDAGQRA